MKTGKTNRTGISSRRNATSRRPGPGEAWPCAPADNWRLPSGEGLAEFALHDGVVALLLLSNNVQPSKPEAKAARKGGRRSGTVIEPVGGSR